MRKINRTITVRVRVPAAAPSPPAQAGTRGSRAAASGHFGLRKALLGQGAREESGWGLCRGQWTSPSEISHSARATRSHAPRPPALSQRWIYSSALPEPPTPRGCQSLRPALAQPFIRPSPPACAGPWSPSRLQPSRAGRGRSRTQYNRAQSDRAEGKGQGGGRPSRGVSGRLQSPRTPSPPACSLRHLVPTCQCPRVPTPLSTLSPPSC